MQKTSRGFPLQSWDLAGAREGPSSSWAAIRKKGQSTGNLAEIRSRTLVQSRRILRRNSLQHKTELKSKIQRNGERYSSFAWGPNAVPQFQ